MHREKLEQLESQKMEGLAYLFNALTHFEGISEDKIAKQLLSCIEMYGNKAVECEKDSAVVQLFK